MSAATGRRKRHKGKQAYSVLTVNGRICLRRVRWHCPQEGSETPIDRVIDEAEASVSEGVREMACRVNQGASSFSHAAEILARAAHLDISKESLRRLVESEGREILKLMSRSELTPSWSTSDCKTDNGATRVYLGCDGVKVPLVTDEEKRKRRKKARAKRQRRGRKCKPLSRAARGADNAYKEFKIGYLYDETKERRYVDVTSGNHDAAGRMLYRMATQVGFFEAQERIALIDGAPWIRNQIELHGLTNNIGLDFYHLQDYAQKTRRATFGEDSPEGRRWLGGLMRTFKHDGYVAGRDAILEWRKTLRGSKRTTANRLLQYAAERREMIRYPEFASKQWQIGSGPTEAACKTTTHRVKGRGRRWDVENAEAMMAIAALHDNRLWRRRWQNLTAKH